MTGILDHGAMTRYSVLDAQYITPTVLSLKLQLSEGERLFTFQPGQYAGISYRRGFRPSAVRCFSIVSSPTEQGVLRFGIRVGGHFTHALTKLKPGDAINVTGPFGSFVFDTARHQRAVLLAGGIGITPFVSMARFAATIEAQNSLTIVHSIRNQDDAPFADELHSLTHGAHNLRVLYTVSDGPTDKLQSKQIYRGRISPETLHDAVSGDYRGVTFFICGPPPFMKSVTAMLQKQGVANNNIITEAFGQVVGRQTSKVRSWPYNIYALGAFGTAAAFVMVMSNDMLKTIPATNMPNTLTAKSMPGAANSRQNDLDALVNNLAATATTQESPAVSSANQAVADANAKIAEVNAINAANGATVATTNKTSTPTASPTPSTTTTPVASAPAPAPAPTPVCTTSASGVTTCH
jgi:ferredoxin-NADP reductase